MNLGILPLRQKEHKGTQKMEWMCSNVATKAGRAQGFTKDERGVKEYYHKGRKSTRVHKKENEGMEKST